MDSRFGIRGNVEHHMKLKTATAVIGVLLLIGTAQSQAQNLVQTLKVSLVGYNNETGRAFSINTADVIRYFMGTNIPGGQLQLVTPVGNPPGSTGNLNAFLRVAQRGVPLLDVTSPTQFNLFQDTAVVVTKNATDISRAINRFSIDYGYLHAELEGFSTWKIRTTPLNGNDVSGSGSFTSTVNGTATVDGVTSFSPVRGTITASAPKPEAQAP